MVLGITLGYLFVLTFGTYNGSELVTLYCSTDGTADGKFYVLLLQFRLGSEG